MAQEGGLSEPKGSYTRDALRTGIEMSHAEGFNPYRFGVIGSSDGHNASSPVEEDNYHGKLPILDGSAATRLKINSYLPTDIAGGMPWGAAGLAAVWAEENTRASLFDAMLRKETYATSGPRITVRFFGGWGYDQSLFEQEDWLAVAEQTGVPMGGTLPPLEQVESGENSRTGKLPTFAVLAMSDPRSGNLDRIQVIKGWVASDGDYREKVYNVAWSGEREPDSEGVLPAVGNTVNVAEASYTNSIGAGQLSAVWSDTEFDLSEEAFYYARVIEIPTPRWSTYDAKTLGIEPPEPAWLQERAATSAIWHPAIP